MLETMGWDGQKTLKNIEQRLLNVEYSAVVVSAGFDAHVQDVNNDLARSALIQTGCTFQNKNYSDLRRALVRTKVPVLLVLEGGYTKHALEEGVKSILLGE